MFTKVFVKQTHCREVDLTIFKFWGRTLGPKMTPVV
jgi:hypothetical protein